jgi:hypothetical protein
VKPGFNTNALFNREGGNRGGGRINKRMDVHSADPEARLERLLELQREGQAMDREWAEMTRAGYERTASSVFAPRNERWRKHG